MIRMNFEPRSLNTEHQTGATCASKRPVQSSEFKVQSSKFSLLLLLLLLAPAASLLAQAASLDLLPSVQVTSAGIFLDDLATSTNTVVPHVRISAAPRFGQSLTLSRQQIITAASRAIASATTFTGDEVRVTRRARALDEEELKLLVTAQLQRDFVKDRGELDLRLARPWSTVTIPDEPLSLRISELPATGLSPLFIARIELGSTNEIVGPWQVSLSAKLWRDVWTSRTALRRGALLVDADIVRERRDVLAIREALAEFTASDPTVESAEYIAPNTPLLARSIKARPVVRRGQSAEAVVADGALIISMKVEVLEDGAPGQVVRVRNPQTKRELRGKVQSEQTILVSL